MGGLWVVQYFGIEPAPMDRRLRAKEDRWFLPPDNKENHIARWLIAMYDVTKKVGIPGTEREVVAAYEIAPEAARGRRYFVWN